MMSFKKTAFGRFRIQWLCTWREIFRPPLTKKPCYPSAVTLYCPGTSGLARHTLCCPFISAVPKATHEASCGPLKGAVSAFKSPSRFWDKRVSCWEEWKRKVFLWLGVIDFLFRQINDFSSYLAPLLFDCLHPPCIPRNVKNWFYK